MTSIPKTISDGSVACILRPTRIKILSLLREEGELSISEITSKLNLSRLSVCHHLAILHACGLIKDEYRITNPSTNHKRGKALQYFSATDKVNQVIADIKEFLNNLEEVLKR